MEFKAKATSHKGKVDLRCHKCGKMGHVASACNTPPFCWVCRTAGHKAINCPKKQNLTPSAHGYASPQGQFFSLHLSDAERTAKRNLGRSVMIHVEEGQASPLCISEHFNDIWEPFPYNVRILEENKYLADLPSEDKVREVLNYGLMGIRRWFKGHDVSATINFSKWDFEEGSSKLQKIWVIIGNLPDYFCSWSILSQIGDSLGKYICADDTTLSKMKKSGSARIYIGVKDPSLLPQSVTYEADDILYEFSVEHDPIKDDWKEKRKANVWTRDNPKSGHSGKGKRKVDDLGEHTVKSGWSFHEKQMQASSWACKDGILSQHPLQREGGNNQPWKMVHKKRKFSHGKAPAKGPYLGKAPAKPLPAISNPFQQDAPLSPAASFHERATQPDSTWGKAQPDKDAGWPAWEASSSHFKLSKEMSPQAQHSLQSPQVQLQGTSKGPPSPSPPLPNSFAVLSNAELINIAALGGMSLGNNPQEADNIIQGLRELEVLRAQQSLPLRKDLISTPPPLARNFKNSFGSTDKPLSVYSRRKGPSMCFWDLTAPLLH